MSKKRYDVTYTEGQQPADMTPEFEKLGRSGWELVSVVFDTKATKYVAFLKKKIHLKKSHHADEDGIDLE